MQISWHNHDIFWVVFDWKVLILTLLPRSLLVSYSARFLLVRFTCLYLEHTYSEIDAKSLTATVPYSYWSDLPVNIRSTVSYDPKFTQISCQLNGAYSYWSDFPIYFRSTHGAKITQLPWDQNDILSSIWLKVVMLHSQATFKSGLVSTQHISTQTMNWLSQLSFSMLRLLSLKTQERRPFWTPFKPFQVEKLLTRKSLGHSLVGLSLVGIYLSMQ